MIVNRWTHIAKVGRMEDLIELHKAEAEHSDAIVRIYRSSIGSNLPALAVELEFENLGDYEKFWDEWNASRGASFAEKLWPLIESGSQQEIWILVE